MGLTITEKILASHAGKAAVEPGEFIIARPDMVMGNDLSTAGAIGVLREMGATKVFDPEKIAIVFDHIVPARDIQAADLLKGGRQWVREQGIALFYDEGRHGIAHIILPEQGLALPGDLIIGGDSHSCTYGAVGAFSTGVGHTDLAGVLALGEIWLKVPASIKFTYHGTLGPWIMGKDLILATIGKIGIDGALYQAMEFRGPALATLGMSERLTMCNMAIEAGGKSGVGAPARGTLQLHPRQHVDLEPGAEGGPARDIRRGRRRRLDADLRGLLRRSHGGPGGGRSGEQTSEVQQPRQQV